MKQLLKELREKRDMWNNSTKETRARRGAYVDCIVMCEEQYKITTQRMKNIDRTNAREFADWILNEGWKKCTEHDGLWENDNSSSLKTSIKLYEQYIEDTQDTDEV
jgi:hypothetical protein